MQPVMFAGLYLLAGLGFHWVLSRYVRRLGVAQPSQSFRDDVETVLLWPAWLIFLGLCALGVLGDEE